MPSCVGSDVSQLPSRGDRTPQGGVEGVPSARLVATNVTHVEIGSYGKVEAQQARHAGFRLGVHVRIYT